MSAVATKWGPHFKGLTDVPVVHTDTLDEIGIRVAEASLERAILRVTGPVGCGKSFSVGRAVEAAAADPDLPATVHWLDLTRNTGPARLLEEIFVTVLGVEPATRTKPRILFAELAEAFESQHRILVVDEAQHAAKPGLLELRGFHDRADADFALVLIGTPDLKTRLARELRSRASLFVDVEGIDDSAIVDVLHAYDPLFTTAQPRRLRDLNAGAANREFRWWAQFLLRARRYAATSDEPIALTDDVIADVVASIPPT